MKVKNIVVGALLVSSVVTCQANELIGGLLGAAIGSRFGSGTGQLIATGVGAIVGMNVASSMEHQQPIGYVNGQPVGVGRPMGNDFCIQDQMSRGNEYGVAASYCEGARQRRLIEQQRMQEDAYRRGLNGY